MNKNITCAIKTAVIPAAGMGRRLKPYTTALPKCMLKVGSKPILQHTIEALEKNGFEHLIIITGHKAEVIKNFLHSYQTSLKVSFVHNDDYDSTNNIYSLALAFPLLTEGFMLIESDLIIDPEMYQYFIEPDRIALDKYDPNVHSGTTAHVCNKKLRHLYVYHKPDTQNNIHKTVNIYSFSAESVLLLQKKIWEYVDKGELQIFYEKAISDLINTESMELVMVDFSDSMWHEIDTAEDLAYANSTHSGSEILFEYEYANFLE